MAYADGWFCEIFCVEIIESGMGCELNSVVVKIKLQVTEYNIVSSLKNVKIRSVL